jgi:hypothetical protein
VTPSQLHLDGSESPPEPVIRKGFCRCGCGDRVEGFMEYRPAHRQRAYRRRVKAEMERAGLPASPSLRAAGVSRGTTARNGDAPAVRNGALRPRSRSGLQVSYRKAVEAACRAIVAWHNGQALSGGDHTTWDHIAQEIAEEQVRASLSPRQQQILNEREQPHA